jgi:hypothetical protein
VTLEAAATPVRRNRRFWLLATLIGIGIAPLAGALGAALVTIYITVSSRLGGKVAWNVLDDAGIIFILGVVLALPLAPVTAASVPLIYGWAMGRGARKRLAFMALAAFVGVTAPILIAVIVSVALWKTDPLSVGGLYGLIGLFVAPLCAWLVWPILRRLDRAIVSE